jgi:hypothetical protein
MSWKSTVRAAVVAAIAATCLPILSAATAAAATDPAPAQERFVPDVVAQFDALALRPDGLAFDIGNSPDPNTCQHYQGVARTQGADGTPYLFITRSGVVPTGCSGTDDPGNLLVVKLGSRDRNGERLRSNRLFPDIPPFLHANDVVVKTISFDGGSAWPAYRSSTGWPAYGHPGGMQLVGDVLAIGVESPYAGAPGGAIVFLDVSFPAVPRFLSVFPLEDAPTDGFGAGTLGVTPVMSDGQCCRYLMLVTGKDNTDLRFFLSRRTGDAPTTDLRASDLDWIPLRRYLRSELETADCIGEAVVINGIVVHPWPSGLGPGHQMLNFVRQGSLGGPLYLVGARNTFAGGIGSDMLDLYRIEVVPDLVAEQPSCPFHAIRAKHMTTYPYGQLGESANFATGSGVYVSPSGELIVYATDYENTGPPLLGPGDVPSALFAEFRHRNMVRPDSPTLHPTASVDGPFAVDEGSSIALTGHGEAAITKAWIQLFEDDGAGHSLPAVDNDEWLAVDYADRNADDFDDLAALGSYDRMVENAGSWRWFAPVGCTISANDYPFWSDEFPGPDTKLLVGTGDVHELTDLDSIGFDDDLEGVTFFHKNEQGALVHDCEGYYGAPMGLGWDLDGDGSFETSGTSAPFSAATLDGPLTATVSARATHPTDPTPLGVGVPVEVPVSVQNVPPTIESAGLTDSVGNDVALGGALALAGLPVNLDVTFRDPGVADTQTASIDWGDETPADTAFASFSDANSGALGSLHDLHTFATSGTYAVVATITDDDGGSTPATVSVEVVTPADLIQDLADELTALIAGATNANVAAALRSARDELIGNHGGKPPTNGALDKLEDGDPVGAITKISAAISYLAVAEASGAGDLTTTKDLLGLVAQAMATGAYADAQAAVAPPSPGEARALATIADLIALGHRQLVDGLYANACDSFKQAAAKAVKLAG